MVKIDIRCLNIFNILNYIIYLLYLKTYNLVASAFHLTSDPGFSAWIPALTSASGRG